MLKETFQKWANDVGDSATGKNEGQHPVWIVRAPFCAMWYVNNGCCLPGDEVLKYYWVRKSWTKNVKLF